MASALDHLLSLAMFVLLGVAIAGPIYAFVAMSCISMERCKIGRLVWSAGMVCAEGPIEELMHGEECTLVCPEGFEPTSPKLVCQDGDPIGAEGLKCRKKRVFVVPEAGGLVDGAVTTRPLRTACLRLQHLKCDATPGGSALLLKLQNMTRPQCNELFDECQGVNPIVTFMDHLRYASEMQKDPVAAQGSCTFGCFIPPLDDTSGWGLPGPTPKPEAAFPAPRQIGKDTEFCPGDPICININTSCNDEDNTDYYRFPTCASGRPQWVSLDQKRRIRFDEQAQFSQGGKWLLEMGVNPATSMFGEEIARQPSFDVEPVFLTTDWNFKCYRWLNPQQALIDYKPVEINLQECTCDSWNDCSRGQGQAVGSKALGPNCGCRCFPGFRGETCEIKLCKVPDVLNGHEPACAEGRYIEAGKTCTPMCNEGYATRAESYRCSDDGTILQPGGFECLKSRTLPPADDMDLEQFGVQTTTPLPDCASVDCSYRGKPTGERRADGSCICECFLNFTGQNCMNWKGTCVAPLIGVIPFADRSPCKEGTEVPTVCTAVCEEGYFPLPEVLQCRDDTLDPPVFGCYGGPSVRDVWCEMMQEIAMYSTIVSLVMLLIFCFAKYKLGGLTISSFFWRGETFEVRDIDDAKVYVVQPRGQDDIRNLPKRVEGRMHQATNEEISEMRAIEEGKLYTNSLFEVEEIIATGMASSENGRWTTTPWPNCPPVVEAVEEEIRPPPDLVEFRDEEGKHVEFRMEPSGVVNFIVSNQLKARNITFHSVMRNSLRFQGDESDDIHTVNVPPDYQDEVEPMLDWMMMPRNSNNEVIEEPEEFTLLPGEADITDGGSSASNAVADVGLLKPVPYTPPRKRAEMAREVRAAELAAMDPVPEITQDLAWSVKVLKLEENALEAKRQHQKKLQVEQNSAAAGALASQAARLKATAGERAEVSQQIRDAMSEGDGPKLRIAVNHGYEVLEKLVGLPPGPTASFKRLMLTAETRVEQFEEREAARKSKREHEERVEQGLAPDWTITADQLWKYAEDGNVAKVHAGLRAQLPVMPKSKDGRRLTVLHVACRPACKESEHMMETRLMVVEALVNARALVNAADIEDRTPLDLAVCEGGPGAEDLPIIARLRLLGLRTAGEAGAEARARSPLASSAHSPAAAKSLGEDEFPPKSPATSGASPAAALSPASPVSQASAESASSPMTSGRRMD